MAGLLDTSETSNSARAVQGQSLPSFASALGVGVAVSAIQLLWFVLLKDKIPKVYQPKAFLVPARQRSPPIPPGPWKWLIPMFKRSDDDFLRRCGLDAYFLSRYLFVLLKILFPISIVALPVLLAIDATGGNNVEGIAMQYSQNQTKGLDILTMSNVSPKYYNRLWAHCLLAVAIVVWACYVIVMELQLFVRVRQTFLTSPQHRLRASASTVLVRSLPRTYDNEHKIIQLFDVYPGGIRNVWINRDYTALDKIVKSRRAVARKLELAETQLIQKCWAAHRAKLKGKQNTTLAAPQDDDAHGTRAIFTPSSDDVSANNPGQVHHSVNEAVSAIAKDDDIDIVGSRLDAQGLLGRGFGAVNQGIHTLGRGIGDGIGQIGQLGEKFSQGIERRLPNDDKARLTGPIAVLSRMLSCRPKPRYEAKRHGSPAGETVVEDSKPDQPTMDKPGPLTDDESEEGARISLFDLQYDNDENTSPRWKEFIDPKDRPTMKLKKRFSWLPSFMNPTAVKVDTIWHCRRELARLNRLVEGLQDSRMHTRFPTMRSAFVQFNNQAAAHMACQSLAHHSPTFMAPRLVEISPNDVVWENMSIPGWAQYVRTGLGFVTCIVILALWTPAIAVSSAISQFDALRKQDPFRWAEHWPAWSVSLIQGLLPVILINILVLILGVVLRLVIKRLGSPTNMRVELTVQKYFFTFSFIQYFLIVTVASAISRLYTTFTESLSGGDISVWLIPRTLAQNMPAASTYFLSNILLQSLSQSAAGLLQPLTLIVFTFGLITNATARTKFKRRTSLEVMNWGTTYPIYTVFACIAIIYSIISPLILPLSMIGFGIWWISTRYQMLYIFKYTSDTGGLLYPMAIKQLFTGLIVLELYLIGYFIVATAGTSGITPSKGQIIPMIVIIVILLIGTVLFYFLIKTTFDPLLEYLPITLEDGAVRKDKEFAKLLASRHSQGDEDAMMQGATDGRLSDTDEAADERPDDQHDIEAHAAGAIPQHVRPLISHGDSWASERRRSAVLTRRSASDGKLGDEDDLAFSAPRVGTVQSLDTSDFSPQQGGPFQQTTNQDGSITGSAKKSSTGETDRNRFEQLGEQLGARTDAALNLLVKPLIGPMQLINPGEQVFQAQKDRFDAEAQEIYGNTPKDLENLTSDQRDALLSRAFRHRALRAKRPCVWLPRDDLGVSEDEVKTTALFTRWIWISNEKQALNDKGKCIYSGSPPDFDEVDLIQL